MRRAFEYYRARDFDALEQIIHPEVVAMLTVPLGAMHVHHGRSEVLATLRDRESRYADYRAAARTFTATPDGRVFVEGVASYKPVGGGRGAAQISYWLYEVRDGMIVRMESILDRSEALAAAGLQPLPST